MEKIEYTWNELETEKLRFSAEGKTFTSLGGPEETHRLDRFWSPALDEAGERYDLYWMRSGSFGDADFFTLQEFDKADL
jgi:hypothetical protein